MSVIKTGYFHNLRGNEIKGAVSIAVGSPRYVKVPHSMKKLAPSWGLLNAFRNEEIDEAEYVERFMAQLNEMDAEEVWNELVGMAGEEPVIMCHCGKQHFCHRHLVAEWFEKMLGKKVDEYSVGSVERKNGRIV